MTTGPKGSKPAREIFLTSSSLSFSSFSSSSRASLDAIEINMESSTTSRGDQEDQKERTLLKASSRGSEMSCLTHVTMQPAPSPPSKFRPGSPYDPQRIPASVFGKETKDSNWSNDSLFSLRMSNYEGFRQSNLMPEEFLAYSPSLKVKSEEDAEEDEITQAMKKTKTSVVEETNNIHREKSLSPTPSAYSYPSSFAQLYQAPPSNKVPSISIPVREKKSKKMRKKTRKSKKEKKNNNNKCCCSICSWLFSKCKYCCCCCK